MSDVTAVSAAGVSDFMGRMNQQGQAVIAAGEQFKTNVTRLGGEGLVGDADNANQKMALDVDNATAAVREALQQTEGKLNSAQSDLFGVSARGASAMGGF
ncbi:hypothetical protein [Corynebacterium sp. AOP12-C2-36]|uniref:hypothetical protein n=1 Tax=Corynebacterium sp. AOP12-C2-36 TaxID=3457723 RepID=UPI0040340F2F